MTQKYNDNKITFVNTIFLNKTLHFLKQTKLNVNLHFCKSLYYLAQ